MLVAGAFSGVCLLWVLFAWSDPPARFWTLVFICKVLPERHFSPYSVRNTRGVLCQVNDRINITMLPSNSVRLCFADGPVLVMMA